MKTKRKFNLIPKDIGDYVAYSEEVSSGLVWRVNRGKNFIKGKETGYPDGKGYLRFTFRYRKYKNSRVIYFLNTGIDPEEKQVDHIDGDILNNKIYNLRLATNKQNSHNRKKSKANTSGVTGVCWDKRRNKYMSNIICNSKLLGLGRFDDFSEAVAVRIAAGKDPRFKDQEFRNPHNDEYIPTPEMLEWAKQYLEDRIERLNWNI